MKSAWIVSPTFDSVWFLGVPLLSVAIAILAPIAEPGVLVWLTFAAVVVVDIGHVYTTVYRTYLDPEERDRRRRLLWVLPASCFVLSFLLLQSGLGPFRHVLAYLAIIHFVRQQFGFLMLYRKASGDKGPLWLDKAAIYLATLYPLARLHARPYGYWFYAGDLLLRVPGWVATLVGIIAVCVLAAFFARELSALAARRPRWGKLVTTASTAAVWYIALDGERAAWYGLMLAHGIPYAALVWSHGERRWAKGRGLLALVHRVGFGPVVFVASIVAVGMLDYKLRSSFWLASPPNTWGLALMASTQVTHYLLDAFIWRLDGSNPVLEEMLGIVRKTRANQ
jgi:hypothetical protein